jgi:hypothetical protein
MLPSVNGGLAPARRVQERRTEGANNNVESKTSVLLPDGAGNWQVDETRQTSTRQEGKNLSSEERVSRVGPDGKLGEVSRTVTKESEGASGEKRNTVETYSLRGLRTQKSDAPGGIWTVVGNCCLAERQTTRPQDGSCLLSELPHYIGLA